MRKLIFGLVSSIACSFSVIAKEYPSSFQSIGKAELSILWFDIYQSELKNPSGKFNSISDPMSLTLTYQRAISKQDLVDETISQWQKQNVRLNQSNEWAQQISQIWPDINKNDQLTFYQDGDLNGHFYLNGELIGSIEDPVFTQSFLAIWLSENSDYPDLTKALKGLNDE